MLRRNILLVRVAEYILEQAQRPRAVPVCRTLALLHRLPVQHPLVPDVLVGDRVSLLHRDRDWLFRLRDVVRCVCVWEFDDPGTLVHLDSREVFGRFSASGNARDLRARH